MSSSIQNVASLLASAQTNGALSPQAASALAVPVVGAQIADGLGVGVDDVEASEVVLLAILIDDSGSIQFAGNSQAVRDGHNLCVDSLKATKQKDGILGHCRYLNGKVLYEFRPIERAEQMTTKNYRADGGTPLYDQTVVILGTVLAKAQEFEDAGVPCRTITVIVTDGADAGSHRQSSTSVRTIVLDMLRKERHIIAFMGIKDEDGVDYEFIAQEMGIPPEWILTPNSDSHSIREAFRMVSQSAVRASQTAGSFSQTALGGFATP